jgi:hypothetical protein
VSVVNVSAFGETTAVNTSGVIVRNDDRGIWTTDVSKGRLAFAGRAVVHLGGIGWRERVVVERTGWRVAGDGVAYRIDGTHDGETRTLYRSPPARAEPVIGGRNVTVVPRADGFVVRVSQDNQTTRASLPSMNESVFLDGVELRRTEEGLVARYEETRITVAEPERYRGRQNQD